AQFLAVASSNHGAALSSEVVLPDGSHVRLKRIMLYPKPGIMSVHTMAPLNEWGQQVADLLVKDNDLVRLAAEHGFRPVDKPSVFAHAVEEQATGQAEVTLPPSPVSLPPIALWNDFTAGVVDAVYGKDRAGVACG